MIRKRRAAENGYMASRQDPERRNGRHAVILVTLEDRFSMARIPSLLQGAGCDVTVLGDPRAPVCASRFVERAIPCPIDPPSAARAINNLVSQYGDNLPWVIFGDEQALQAGILCRQEKWFQQVFPVDPFKCADMIFRKAAFMEAAAKSDVPIPPTRICRSAADATSAADELNFPLFLKRDFDCAGSGVVRVSDKSEVVPVYQKLSDTGPVVIQEMIHGASGKTNALYNRGRLMCHTSAYTVQTWLGQFGPGCVRQYFCDGRLEKIAADIGAVTGFNGLCGFDWIHDEQSDRFVVIEFNGRISATYHLGKYVHVDYGRAVADFLEGRLTVQQPHLSGSNRPVIHMFPQDVRRCISDKDIIGLTKWLSGALTTDIPWGDANLILFFLMDLINLGCKRLSRFLWRQFPLESI
jgi:predicted ATP-grasp superfamily ATP-dependent carboligase